MLCPSERDGLADAWFTKLAAEQSGRKKTKKRCGDSWDSSRAEHLSQVLVNGGMKKMGRTE